MKIVGIIGFILILLGDLGLFFTSMNMPAGSKTAGAFLIFALITLIVVIIYFIGALKQHRMISLISSIFLIVVPIIGFLTTGIGYKQDVQEYGKYLDVNTAFMMFIMLLLCQIIFGIIGVIMSAKNNKNTKNSQIDFK